MNQATEELPKLQELTERIVDGNYAWSIEDEFYRLNEAVDAAALREGMRQGYVVPLKVSCLEGGQKIPKYIAMIRGENNWQNILSASENIPAAFENIGRILYEIGQEERKFSHFEKLINIKSSKDCDYALSDVYIFGRKVMLDHSLDSSLIDRAAFTLLGADPNNMHLRSVSIRLAEDNGRGRFNPIEPICPNHESRRGSLTWECINEIKRKLRAGDRAGAFYLDVSLNSDY